jgi:predicted DNA-binding protein
MGNKRSTKVIGGMRFDDEVATRISKLSKKVNLTLSDIVRLAVSIGLRRMEKGYLFPSEEE